MNITLVHPANSSLSYQIPLGILALASYIDKHTNHHIKCLHLAPYILDGTIPKNEHIYTNAAQFLLEAFPSDCYGFSTYVTIEIPALQIAKALKKLKPEVEIIFGNQWAASNEVGILEHFPQIDWIIKGEAELPLLHLLNELEKDVPDFSTIDGITYRKEGMVHRNKSEKRIDQLDELPFLNFELLYPPLKDYPKSKFGGNYGLLEYGRGCPYTCSFCATTFHWEPKVYIYSVQRAIEDIKLYKKNGVDFIEFTYDNFTTKKKELIRFLKAITPLKIKFSIRCRLDHLNEPLIKQLSKAGCVSILVGLESSSQDVIDRINKKLSLKKAMDSLFLLVKHGIRPDISIVTGLPFETNQDVQMNLYLAAILSTFKEDIGLGIHYCSPLPATPLTNEALKNNTLNYHKDISISPDFCRNLSWLRPFERFPEDQKLIDLYPALFTSYGYIENKHVSSHTFAALSSYFDLLIKFYPLTISLLLVFFEKQNLDFLSTLENYMKRQGKSQHWLRTIYVEYAAFEKKDCNDSTKELLVLFKDFVHQLEQLPSPIIHTITYEYFTIHINLFEHPDEIQNFRSSKFTEQTKISTRVRLLRVHYNMESIQEHLVNLLVSQNHNLNWQDIPVDITYYGFTFSKPKGSTYNEVIEYEFDELTYTVLKGLEQRTSIQDIVDELYDHESEYLRKQKKKKLVQSFKRNPELLEI